MTKQERVSNGKKTVSLANGDGELDSNMKNETRPLSYTMHKNKLKMDERPKCKTGSHQNPRGESRQELLTQHISGGKGNKSKNELLGHHQNKTSAQRRKQSVKLKGN